MQQLRAGVISLLALMINFAKSSHIYAIKYKKNAKYT